MFAYDSAPARITIFTIAQILPLALSVKLLLTPHQGRVNPGARLAAIVSLLIIAIYGFRLVGAASAAASPTWNSARCSRP